MSRKKNGKHWYQVHKSRAGTESVEYSKGVAEARAKVRELEGQFLQIMVGYSASMASEARRMLFGRSKQEELIYQAELRLKDAKADEQAAVRVARQSGERSYGVDWVSRNPDKSK